MTVAFFLTAFLTLGVMIWPYMIPYALTVADAAAPDASLRFFFYGGDRRAAGDRRLHDRRLLGLSRQDWASQRVKEALLPHRSANAVV